MEEGGRSGLWWRVSGWGQGYGAGGTSGLWWRQDRSCVGETVVCMGQGYGCGPAMRRQVLCRLESEAAATGPGGPSTHTGHDHVCMHLTSPQLHPMPSLTTCHHPRHPAPPPVHCRPPLPPPISHPPSPLHSTPFPRPPCRPPLPFPLSTFPPSTPHPRSSAPPTRPEAGSCMYKLRTATRRSTGAAAASTSPSCCCCCCCGCCGCWGVAACGPGGRCAVSTDSPSCTCRGRRHFMLSNVSLPACVNSHGAGNEVGKQTSRWMCCCRLGGWVNPLCSQGSQDTNPGLMSWCACPGATPLVGGGLCS
jgi:hypothetical protein